MDEGEAKELGHFGEIPKAHGVKEDVLGITSIESAIGGQAMEMKVPVQLIALQFAVLRHLEVNTQTQFTPGRHAPDRLIGLFAGLLNSQIGRPRLMRRYLSTPTQQQGRY